METRLHLHSKTTAIPSFTPLRSGVLLHESADGGSSGLARECHQNITRKTTYKVGEEIRVIHIAEVTEPGHLVYVMGLKPVHGEYVNGQLVTEASGKDEDPLAPQFYDGATVASPAVDITTILQLIFSRPPDAIRLAGRLALSSPTCLRSKSLTTSTEDNYEARC
jgi:hypothetical protein